MKTLVIYYSYTGHTKRLAEREAAKESADIYEVREKKRMHTLKAYTIGCFLALRQKKTAVQPITAKINNYDKIIIMAPIWAGKPAPAINHVFEMIAPGKNIDLKMVSASGSSTCKDKLVHFLKNKGCSEVNFEDIKGK